MILFYQLRANQFDSDSSHLKHSFSSSFGRHCDILVDTIKLNISKQTQVSRRYTYICVILVSLVVFLLLTSL